MSDRVVRLSFPARAEYLILGRLALAGVARAVPVDDETLADLKLVVTEACGNVVRHAYDPDGDGRVRLTISASDAQVTIAVSDDGAGLPVKRSEGAADELPESGMGLAIIAAIADELDIAETGDSGGTTLTIRKRL